VDEEGPPPPDGWVSEPYLALTPEERGGDRPVECWECGWKGHESDVDMTLSDIKDLGERLTPGDPSPYGLCPSWISDDSTVPATFVCSCFVYYTDIQVAYRKMPDVLDRIVEECS
jgi:hypothetical protein